MQNHSTRTRKAKYEGVHMDKTLTIIYGYLVQVAREKGITNYTEVGQLVSLDMSTEIGRIRIAQMLD